MVKDGVATENFVYRQINSLKEEMDERFDKLERKLDDKFSMVMKHLVDIAGKFQKFDEEQVIIAGRMGEHDDRIEKLEKRVFKAS